MRAERRRTYVPYDIRILNLPVRCRNPRDSTILRYVSDVEVAIYPARPCMYNTPKAHSIGGLYFQVISAVHLAHVFKQFVARIAYIHNCLDKQCEKQVLVCVLFICENNTKKQTTPLPAARLQRPNNLLLSAIVLDRSSCSRTVPQQALQTSLEERKSISAGMHTNHASDALWNPSLTELHVVVYGSSSESRLDPPYVDGSCTQGVFAWVFQEEDVFVGRACAKIACWAKQSLNNGSHEQQPAITTSINIRCHIPPPAPLMEVCLMKPREQGQSSSTAVVVCFPKTIEFRYELTSPLDERERERER